MHDGYLFTLGVCGSAGGPAAAILDAMLAALPPVKRAAYLGEVLVSAGPPSLDDPLTAPLLADVADAELLLLVAPLPDGRLPARLEALARALTHAPPPAARRLAVLITLGDAAPGPALAAGLAAAGADLAGALQLPADANLELAIPQASALARDAYARARTFRPEALPQTEL
jgi:hypothetical protein